MEDITITRHEETSTGEYHAHVSGSKHIGRLTWVTRDGARVAEHTLVPPELGGRGIAGKLVDALIADAREQGFKVVPECSYVAAAFAKHPEWATCGAKPAPRRLRPSPRRSSAALSARFRRSAGR